MSQPAAARVSRRPATPVATVHHNAAPSHGAGEGAARLRLVRAPAQPPASPTPRSPPETTIQRIALYAFEAVEGTRTIAQLAGTVTPEVARELQQRRALRTERRTLTRDDRRIVAVPGRAHISRPHPDVLEAAVVLHARGRTSAVALRFEQRSGRWRATEVTVL